MLKKNALVRKLKLEGKKHKVFARSKKMINLYSKQYNM